MISDKSKDAHVGPSPVPPPAPTQPPSIILDPIMAVRVRMLGALRYVPVFHPAPSGNAPAAAAVEAQFAEIHRDYLAGQVALIDTGGRVMAGGVRLIGCTTPDAVLDTTLTPVTTWRWAQHLDDIAVAFGIATHGHPLLKAIGIDGLVVDLHRLVAIASFHLDLLSADGGAPRPALTLTYLGLRVTIHRHGGRTGSFGGGPLDFTVELQPVLGGLTGMIDLTPCRDLKIPDRH